MDHVILAPGNTNWADIVVGSRSCCWFHGARIQSCVQLNSNLLFVDKRYPSSPSLLCYKAHDPFENVQAISPKMPTIAPSKKQARDDHYISKETQKKNTTPYKDPLTFPSISSAAPLAFPLTSSFIPFAVPSYSFAVPFADPEYSFAIPLAEPANSPALL